MLRRCRREGDGRRDSSITVHSDVRETELAHAECCCVLYLPRPLTPQPVLPARSGPPLTFPTSPLLPPPPLHQIPPTSIHLIGTKPTPRVIINFQGCLYKLSVVVLELACSLAAEDGEERPVKQNKAARHGGERVDRTALAPTL